APGPRDGLLPSPVRGEPGARPLRRAHRPPAGGGLRAAPGGPRGLRGLRALRRRGLAGGPPPPPLHGPFPDPHRRRGDPSARPRTVAGRDARPALVTEGDPPETHYSVLGLDSRATRDPVERAYRFR